MTLKVTKSGYWYVKLPDVEKVERNKKPIISHSNFDKTKISGEIVCKLKTVTPVHVGSGIFELAKEDIGYSDYDGVVKAIVKENDRPVIPGSSLKGAFRSITEAISYSCILQNKFGFQSCSANDKESKVCVCCNIFGAMGFMGRVRFSKATLIDKVNYQNHKPNQPLKLAALNAPKERKAQKARKFYPPIDYTSQDFWDNGSPNDYYVTVKNARPNEGHLVIEEWYGDKESFKNGKFLEPYEYVPKDVEFRFTVSFENLTKSEIGLILLGMGLNQENKIEFYPRLGGAKPLYLGVVQITVESFIIRNYPEDFNHFNISPNTKNVNEWMQENIQETQKDLQIFYKEGYDRLKNILKYPADIPEAVDWNDVFATFNEQKEKSG